MLHKVRLIEFNLFSDIQAKKGSEVGSKLRVYFIFSQSPEVSQFLKLVDNEEVSCFVEPLDLASKEVIILAVNNATDPSQPGGSHWSLLVYTSQVINDERFNIPL